MEYVFRGIISPFLLDVCIYNEMICCSVIFLDYMLAILFQITGKDQVSVGVVPVNLNHSSSETVAAQCTPWQLETAKRTGDIGFLPLISNLKMNDFHFNHT